MINPTMEMSNRNGLPFILKRCQKSSAHFAAWFGPAPGDEQQGGNPKKGHWCPDARGVGHTGAGLQEERVEWDLRQHDWEENLLLFPFSLPSSSSLVPCSNLASNVLLDLFAVLPLMNFCFLPQIDPQSGMKENTEYALLERKKPHVPWSMTFLS